MLTNAGTGGLAARLNGSYHKVKALDLLFRDMRLAFDISIYSPSLPSAGVIYYVFVLLLAPSSVHSGRGPKIDTSMRIKY
ncbi:hypothetical protein BDZ94DRAFT_1255938 [Collybia nuda]|uniref:Uncharacterized protein n=1 Tax=Collybia nuda TaxID=64659 RepID=A0A9P6CFZ7_9AGAR|nr:hypothetical protein BDZ94DRAFT_1255938 [Collybia nuda]